MKKSEDSLRRLKKGRQGFSLFGNRSVQDDQKQATGEEEKVKVQMNIDVEALARDARGVGVDVENLAVFDSLRTAILDENK
jgi:hypothetical protein